MDVPGYQTSSLKPGTLDTKGTPRRTMRHTLKAAGHDLYLRVRGSSTDELEPQVDPAGEDPWSDLCFYSNPVFIQVAR